MTLRTRPEGPRAPWRAVAMREPISPRAPRTARRGAQEPHDGVLDTEDPQNLNLGVWSSRSRHPIVSLSPTFFGSPSLAGESDSQPDSDQEAPVHRIGRSRAFFVGVVLAARRRGPAIQSIEDAVDWHSEVYNERHWPFLLMGARRRAHAATIAAPTRTLGRRGSSIPSVSLDGRQEPASAQVPCEGQMSR